MAFTLIGAFGVVALVRRGNWLVERFAKLRRIGARALTHARRVHGGIHVVAGRPFPPLAGFFRQVLSLQRRVSRPGANHGLLWLVALALFGSLISLTTISLRFIKVIFPKPRPAETRSLSSPGAERDFPD